MMQITVPGEVNQHKGELLTWGTTIHADEKVIRSVEEIYSGARHSPLGPSATAVRSGLAEGEPARSEADWHPSRRLEP